MYVFSALYAAEVDVTAVNCDTLKVSYTVNRLPYEGKNKASLLSFVVKYQPILGGGSTVTRTVPLNGKPAEGVLCLSGLRPDTPYRVTYNVEVNPGVQIVLPSDLSDPEQLFTLGSCGRLVQQCTERIIARKCELHLQYTTQSSDVPCSTHCSIPPSPQMFLAAHTAVYHPVLRCTLQHTLQYTTQSSDVFCSTHYSWSLIIPAAPFIHICS